MGFTISKNSISDLQYITSINIDYYLIYLSYSHIRNLSRTNKFFGKIIKDNRIMTNILTKKVCLLYPDIEQEFNIFIRNCNVSESILDFDNVIEKFVFDVYRNFPRWVNIELFNLDVKLELYEILTEGVIYSFRSYFGGNHTHLNINEYIKRYLFSDEIYMPCLLFGYKENTFHIDFDPSKTTINYLANLFIFGEKFVKREFNKIQTQGLNFVKKNTEMDVYFFSAALFIHLSSKYKPFNFK